MPTSFDRARILDWVAAGFLALVFGAAGVAKWGRSEALGRDILGYGVVGEPLAGWLALALPALELTIAALVLWPWSRRWAALAAGLSTVAFAMASLQAWGSGFVSACGCFGALSPRLHPVGHLLLWSAMLAAAAWLWWRGEPGLRQRRSAAQ